MTAQRDINTETWETVCQGLATHLKSAWARDAFQRLSQDQSFLHGLEVYERSLHHWQKSINLVSKSTLPEARLRHFVDSLQILDCLSIDEVQPPIRHLDLGSGAGFPGLTSHFALINAGLALETCLVESDRRKAAFLNHVKRSLALTDLRVAQERLENLSLNRCFSTPFDADETQITTIVTARAFRPLPELLSMVQPFSNEKTQIILLKGQGWQEEVDQARNDFDFLLHTKPSLTDDCAMMLDIRHCCLRKT